MSNTRKKYKADEASVIEQCKACLKLSQRPRPHERSDHAVVRQCRMFKLPRYRKSPAQR